MPHAAAVPETSFLAAYGRRGAYTDCFATSVPGRYGLPALIEAFYTTPLFKLERWVLSRWLKIDATDEEARQLALARTDRFAAWKVEQRGDQQILLDAGQTRLWLCVVAGPTGAASTTLLFGSAVVPMRANGRFGLVFHSLIGVHRLYSKLLLAAAARRLASTAQAQAAA